MCKKSDKNEFNQNFSGNTVLLELLFAGVKKIDNAVEGWSRQNLYGLAWVSASKFAYEMNL